CLVQYLKRLYMMTALFDGPFIFFFFQAADGIRDRNVTGVQTCALPIFLGPNVMDPTGAAFIDMSPVFPLDNPALISVPAGFLGAFLGTFLGKQESEEKYREVQVKAATGISTSDISH